MSQIPKCVHIALCRRLRGERMLEKFKIVRNRWPLTFWPEVQA